MPNIVRYVPEIIPNRATIEYLCFGRPPNLRYQFQVNTGVRYFCIMLTSAMVALFVPPQIFNPNQFPSLVASLFSSRCLAASTSSFLHTAMNLRPPSVTVSTHTSAFNAVDFQSPAMPNARMSLWTQSAHSFSFPLRSLCTAPSRFPKTIRFGSRPPFIRRSVLAHKSFLVRNVVSMLSRPVISRARLYEVTRWSGLLRCAPMIRSKTRWCTLRSLE